MRRSSVTTSRCLILPLDTKYSMRAGQRPGPPASHGHGQRSSHSPHKPHGIPFNLLCLRVIF